MNLDGLPAGEFDLSLNGPDVYVRANQASRQRILETLAARAEFSFSGQATGDLTGWFEAPTPAQAIGLLVPGVAFSARFESNALGARLVAVELQAPTKIAGAGLPATSSAALPRDISRNQLGENLAPTTAARISQELHAEWRAASGDIPQRLESGDPQDRLGALEELIVEGGGLEALAAALRYEREAGLRVEMLYKLDESGSVLALQSMLEALTDPDPLVVATAVSLIGDWHDEEVVTRYLQPLEDHPDPRVREAVATAISAIVE